MHAQEKLKVINQSGNILFLILLAVVLFAALSYAVTSSLRGGGKDASTEKAKSLASTMIQYGALVESTITRTRLSSNISEYGLDFDDGPGPSVTSSNGTCNATACRIFTQSSREGLMASQKFGEEYVDPRWRTLFPSWGGGSGTETLFSMAQVQNLRTDNPEIIMRVVGIKPAVCSAINDILWGSVPTGSESYGAADAATAYSGTLTALPATYGVLGDDVAFFKGKNAGCIGREASGYGGDFYYVVMER